MLEWTGERFLPWIRESTIAYEHLHRYAYAASFVSDKRVLDLACGEGYGSRMLAARAAHVTGIDIDAGAVEHASEKYAGDTLQFLRGSITAVPIREDHSFDVIVCFEAIEHIEDHEALLSEVKRLLKPDGCFIVSTPNKAVYRDESPEENPFHVKELDFEEFQQLLLRHFHNVSFLGQRIHPGSSIWPVAQGEWGHAREFLIDRGTSGFDFIGPEQRVPLYFIAFASNASDLPKLSPSVLLDESDSLLQEKQEELQASIRETRWREQQLADREETIQSLDKAIKWREDQISQLEDQVSQLNEGLHWIQNHVNALEQTKASHEQALAWREHQVSDLEAAKAFLERELQHTQRQLGIATNTLAGIYASRGWKWIMRLRSIRDRFKGLLKPRG